MASWLSIRWLECAILLNGWDGCRMMLYCCITQPVGVYIIIPVAYITSAVAAVLIWGFRLDKDENSTTSLSFVLYCGMLASGTSNLVSGTSTCTISLVSFWHLTHTCRTFSMTAVSGHLWSLRWTVCRVLCYSMFSRASLTDMPFKFVWCRTVPP